jgi:hypothetical protein
VLLERSPDTGAPVGSLIAGPGFVLNRHVGYVHLATGRTPAEEERALGLALSYYLGRIN